MATLAAILELLEQNDFSNSEPLYRSDAWDSSNFGSICITVWEEMLLEEFQDGRHGGQLGYQNG